MSICRAYSLVVLLLCSQAQADIVFDVGAGHESSNIDSSDSSFISSHVGGLFVVAGMGLSISLTPLFRVPFIVEFGQNKVSGTMTVSGKENEKDIGSALSVLAKPSLRLGDGRAYLIGGVTMTNVKSYISDVLRSDQKYHMPIIGAGLSYQALPDMDVYAEYRVNGKSKKNIVATTFAGTDLTSLSVYSRHRFQVGVTYYL